MKKPILIFIIMVSSIIISAQDYYNINNDTTWNSDTIFINDNVKVFEDATLSISSGTTIKFNGQYFIEVFGELNAIGQLNDSILFTVNDTTHLQDTSTMSGGWKGIRLLDNIYDTSIFDYCIFQYGKAVVPGIPFWNTTIPENYGGALFIDGYNSVKISNSNFRNNFARDKGGAIYADTMSYFSVDNSEFYSNLAKQQGGALYVGNINDVLISNNLFIWNDCVLIRLDTIIGGYIWSGGGGAIKLSNPLGNSIAKIINNKLFNNLAVGGIINDAYPQTYVYNNILCNNYASTYFCSSPKTHSIFSNNIVANNLAPFGTSGIESSSDYLFINNSIVWNNQCEIPGSNEGQICGVLNYEPIVEYNCVMDGYEGEGNIDSPPLFVNPSAGVGRNFSGADADWTLLDNSPCINTGTPDTTGLYLPEFDLKYNQRVYGNRIDMGAYENQYIWVKINDSPVFNNTVLVYPNPSKQNLNIAIQPDMKGAWIELIDGTGNKIIHSQITTIPALFSPKGLKPGIYFYRIFNHNTVFKTGKWIKN